MKANDIQIGDWLYSIIDRYDHVEKKLCKITGIRTDSDTPLIQCNDTDVWYPLDSYEPVPLTAEILEKNGFEYKEGGKGLFGVTIAPRYLCKGVPFEVFCDGEPFAIWFKEPIDIKYVHQLQHALRLCGITREIII